jgi:hypothetical protein
MTVIFPLDYKTTGIITDDVIFPASLCFVLVTDTTTLQVLHDTLVCVNLGLIIQSLIFTFTGKAPPGGLPINCMSFSRQIFSH